MLRPHVPIARKDYFEEYQLKSSLNLSVQAVLNLIIFVRPIEVDKFHIGILLLLSPGCNKLTQAIIETWPLQFITFTYHFNLCSVYRSESRNL